MVISAKTFTEIQPFVGEMVHKFKTQKESWISLDILYMREYFFHMIAACIYLFLLYLTNI